MSEEQPFKALEYFNRVTRPIVSQPEWDTIIKIIDITNNNPSVTPDIIVPRMLEQLKDKNPKVVWFTLIIIDACVKNCCEEFISKIGTKEFMRRMKKNYL